MRDVSLPGWVQVQQLRAEIARVYNNEASFSVHMLNSISSIGPLKKLLGLRVPKRAHD